jgi:hypothetical protein
MSITIKVDPVIPGRNPIIYILRYTGSVPLN